MIIVFDLDDTLYEEMAFVKSGYMAVSQYLEKKYGLPCEKSFYLMMDHTLNCGRNFVFNNLLDSYNLLNQRNLRLCIATYRSHKPTISLPQDTLDLLARLNNIPLYVITDGNKKVQNNKVNTLGLFVKAQFCFITHRYGLKNSKPSPHCFLKICKNENAIPQKVVYIADNPHKDFVGIKPLGFRTVRILRGPYKNVKLDEKFEAEYNINSLSEINLNFLNQLMGER